jgi:hypothetical protein
MMTYSQLQFQVLCDELKKHGYTWFKLGGVKGIQIKEEIRYVKPRYNDADSVFQGWPAFWDACEQAGVSFGGGCGEWHQVEWNFNKEFTGEYLLVEEEWVSNESPNSLQ